MKIPLIIIGGGLSGLAAAIRFARFSPDVLLIERHTKLGGLNSYYYKNKRLFETGLHAVTNFAPPTAKHAPLNRLFRQLKLNRKTFVVYPQLCSEIRFCDQQTLLFSNDFNLLRSEIAAKFPHCLAGFMQMCHDFENLDPFKVGPFRSAKKILHSYLNDELLIDMLLCPLMYYGSSIENDMDLNQFIIMFRSIFQEGMFRPAGTIRDFLNTLQNHYLQLGGKLRLGTGVARIIHESKKISGIELENGDYLECDYLISTAGLAETNCLLNVQEPASTQNRLGFTESIFLVPETFLQDIQPKRTIIFFNLSKSFDYRKPTKDVDFASGVICFPSHFQGRPIEKTGEIRTTHLANFQEWHKLSNDNLKYQERKKKTANRSIAVIENIIGKFAHHIVYEDTFTPLTINKYTAKKEGAIYGSPIKIKDGNIGYGNLFIAGTDQGFLGIIGSMLSGVSIVNQHILPKI